MKFKPHIPLLLCALACFCWIGLSCSEDDNIPANGVKVGLLLPFTGDDAAIGANYEHAALMVQHEVNKNGGIGGRPLVFITRDTHSTEAGAQTALNQLIDNEVVAVIGPESTLIARSILPRLQQEGLPLISPVISGGDSIALNDSYKWFRLAPSASILGRAFGNNLWDEGVRQLSMVYSSDDYNLDFIGALAQRFELRGGSIAARIYLQDNTLSYQSEVTDLKRGGTANVIVSASVESAARFVNELTTSSGSKEWNWYFSPQLETPVFPQNTFPGAVEGAKGVGIALSGYDEAFRLSYLDTWNTEPLDGAFFYYDAAALLALSLEKVATANQPLTQSAIVPAIDDVAYRQGIQVKWNQLAAGLTHVREGKEISYSGLNGPMWFDEQGQQPKAVLKYWTIIDGEVTDNVQ